MARQLVKFSLLAAEDGGAVRGAAALLDSVDCLHLAPILDVFRASLLHLGTRREHGPLRWNLGGVLTAVVGKVVSLLRGVEALASAREKRGAELGDLPADAGEFLLAVDVGMD